MVRTALLTAALFTAGITGKAVVKGYVQSSPALVVEAADRIPAGAVLPVLLTESVGVYLNGVGDPFSLELIGPVRDRSGELVLPAGAEVHGRIAAIAKPATRGNQMAVGVAIEGIGVDGRRLSADLEVVRVDARATGQTGRAFGAILEPEDAIASTGIDLGEGDGTVIALGMGDADPLLPAGTHFRLRLTSDLMLR